MFIIIYADVKYTPSLNYMTVLNESELLKELSHLSGSDQKITIGAFRATAMNKYPDDHNKIDRFGDIYVLANEESYNKVYAVPYRVLKQFIKKYSNHHEKSLIVTTLNIREMLSIDDINLLMNSNDKDIEVSLTEDEVNIDNLNLLEIS